MMESVIGLREGTAMWLSLEVVRATVLLLAVIGAAVALRRASAGVRHLVLCAGLVSLLALPALSALTPWRWSPLPPAVREIAQSPVSFAGDAVQQPREMQESERVASTAITNPSAESSAPSTPVRIATFVRAHALALILALWAAGALFMIVRMALGAAVLRLALRRATALESPAWRTPLFEAADRLELAAAPRLVQSDRMPMPFVTGLARPTIVLPAAASGWTAERRRAVLLHELAHVRRRDLLLNTLGQVACALWWFHPLARVAARRLRAESERACDDLVLRVGTLPSAYADHLLQIVRDAGRVSAPAIALPMAQRREFEGRMLAILEADARRDPPRRRHAAIALAALALLIVPLVGLGPAPAAAGTPQDPSVAAETDPASPRDDVGPADAAPVADQAEREAEVAQETQVAPPERMAEQQSAVQDTGVVGALRAALRDPSGEVRAEAAWALGSMGATSAGPDLVALLGRDTSAPKAREMAVWSIAELNHRDGVEAIERVARSDASAETREMAVWALGQFEQDSSLPVLLAALGDDDAQVRGIAAWALGTLAPADAPQALISALDDSDGEVREHAAWALGQIGDEDAVPALTRIISDDTAGEAAMWAIGNIGGEAARPALMEALRSGNDEVRAAAARALAGRGGGHPWPWPWPRPITRF